MKSMSRRAPETLADYLVVAICPALIMLLVGSLMYFLVEVFYQGEYKGRLLWVMAMFVLGIVGIARISMEEGLAYASLFGAALAGAIALALMQFVKDGLVIGGPIMALVWWAAHKLTWDCTLIDDAQDVSGQGLLQQMGLDTTAAPADTSSPPGTTSRANEPEATTSTAAAPSPPWWETLLEPDRRPHAPGVWVIYFSLAALPLFGIGGWFVPASDPVARSRVFSLLVIYVASGMGLLLATSFLGLRRYLRQRKLEMPLEMTSTWIIVGVLMIFATLIVATILPRPSREYSLSQLPFTVTSAVRRASQHAMGKEGTKDDAAKSPATTNAEKDQSTKREGKQPSVEQSEGKSQSGEKGDAEGKGKGKGQGKGEGKSKASGGEGKGAKGGESKGDSSKGGSEAKKRDAEAQSAKESKEKVKDDNSEAGKSKADEQQQKQEQKTPGDNSAEPPPPESESQTPSQSNSSPGEMLSKVTSFLGQTVATLLKWVFYAGLAVAGLVAAWVYREELAAAWKKLMEELSELWNWWNGKKATADQPATVGPVVPPPRPFSSYADPFLTGDARGMSWPWLVRYTFEALEAWGREQGCAREIGQTPHEFALAIGAVEPPIAASAQTLAAWYGQLAYAPRAASGGSPDALRHLWSGLKAASSTPASLQYSGSGATTEI